ncbi:AT-rich interactive domain-containing protein 5A [Brachyhypopomus gauderio]|uniref:AT-rich interactive domain-containing protein 5A n=1 Tax=Brachyhypopomus gauderio TaxID=698409 RepID=UPI0040414970
MVSDPHGEASGSEEPIDVCEERTEGENSPNQSNRDMEMSEATAIGAEESRTSQSESEERAFVINLYHFMKERGTPIERIPHLGFKQINLWKIYKAVETLGGYDSVTARRLWKNVYDELGGSPGSTSAATCTRRHYERLVLPFERHRRGEEDKPLPPSKPRKQYKRSTEGKIKAESKKRRRTDREEPEENLRMDHRCERGDCSGPWPVSEHPDGDQHSLASPPVACPKEKPLLKSLSPALVMSPLEKKKRLAQASLSVASPAGLEEGAEPERPSVIQLSYSSQSPACSSSTRLRHASDGSPLPLSSPSASLSRSSSPYSVSSEDCVPVQTQQTPAPDEEKQKPVLFSPVPSPESASARVCKPFSHYPYSKDLVALPRPVYRDFLQVSPTHMEKPPRAPLPWGSESKVGGRTPALRIPISASAGRACWAHSPSSFTKVPPRTPWGPVSLQPPYKLHVPHPQAHPKRPSSAEAFAKKIASPSHFVDRKEKAKMVVPKPLPAQQYILHPQPGLPMPYLLPEQLKTLPVHPVLLPAHLTIPPSQGHPPHPVPMGAYLPGTYEAALRSYPYSVPLCHPPASYNMASLQPF